MGLVTHLNSFERLPRTRTDAFLAFRVWVEVQERKRSVNMCPGNESFRCHKCLDIKKTDGGVSRP